LIAISIIAFPRKRIPTRTHLYAAREEVYPIIDDWQPMRAGLLKLKSWILSWRWPNPHLRS